jgi:chemotaxis protein methyltransferase CheR
MTTSQTPLTMSEAEFEAFRHLLYELSGITLNDNKREMVASRLAKRLRHYALNSFADYHQFLLDSQTSERERQEFINCLTTNKTDFFRESHHFDFLRDVLIPKLRAKGTRQVRIWSAACSTGEEPYTLAMTLQEQCPPSEGWDVRILASDIDTAVLATAEQGIYEANRINGVPEPLRAKYFLRGQGLSAGKVAVKPFLRDRIVFRRINLMDPEWPIRTQFDAIFCRNVVIYFDRPTQRRLLEHFARYLRSDGYLFMGHSENIHWMADRFAPIGNTIYQLRLPTDTPPPRGALPSAMPHKSPQSLGSPEAALPEYSVILGDVKTARGPAIIKTLLGSCVSACIFDPEAKVGGMNHFSLPGVSDEGASTRYGAYAMELLITAIMKQGGKRERLQAKVFGGAKVLNFQSEHLDVGTRNAEFVQQFLAAENIPIVGQSLGGTRGLLVRFRADTGQALVKPLANRDLNGVLREEEQYSRELVAKVQTPSDDGITLF